MSDPRPIAPELTKENLTSYLDMLQVRIDHYKAEQRIRPDQYNLDQIKKLDQMAVDAMDRFHNQ